MAEGKTRPINNKTSSGMGGFLESSGVMVVFRYSKPVLTVQVGTEYSIYIYAMQHPEVRGCQCQWPWGIRLGSYSISIMTEQVTNFSRYCTGDSD